MRTIRPSREMGDTRAADTQTIITEKPSTCTCYRPSPSRRDGFARTLIGSFEGRIDPWRTSSSDMRTDVSGQETDVLFLLTTLYSTDKDGNTINFTRGDELEINGVTYVVTQKIPHASFKNEGLLRLKQ